MLQIALPPEIWSSVASRRARSYGALKVEEIVISKPMSGTATASAVDSVSGSKTVERPLARVGTERRVIGEEHRIEPARMGDPGRLEIVFKFGKHERRAADMAPGIRKISGAIDTGGQDQSWLHRNRARLHMLNSVGNNRADSVTGELLRTGRQNLFLAGKEKIVLKS